jgi:hypothetical protein
VLVVASQPAAFHVERKVTIAAPAEHAYALVNDFHAWKAWSPWEQLDPTMSRSYEGAHSGVGAKYGWAGNSKVGEGRMTIEKSAKNAQISIALEFIKPFPGHNTATFTFVPTSEGTQVTWAMDGRHNLLGKAFSIFMDIDKLLGAEFEQGLTAMKAAAEDASKSTADLARAPN